MPRDALHVLLAGSPFVQIVLAVADGGALVGVVATQMAHRSGLLLVDDVAGRPIDEILRSDFARSVREGFRDSLRLGEPVSHEEFASYGHREVWGLTTITPLLSGGGVPAHIVASFLELDFLERTESALSEIEASLRQLVEASSDVLLVTHDGRVAHANLAAQRHFGMSAAELVGRRLDALLPEGADVHLIPLPSSNEPSSIVVVRRKD